MKTDPTYLEYISAKVLGWNFREDRPTDLPSFEDFKKHPYDSMRTVSQKIPNFAFLKEFIKTYEAVMHDHMENQWPPGRSGY